MWSSISVSDRCSARKLSPALRSGYASAEREHLPHRAAQLSLRGTGCRRAGRRGRAVPRLDHRLDRASLIAGVPLHRLDQSRHQVVPALELHVDVGPGPVRQQAEPRESVVGDDDIEADRRQGR